MAMRASKQPITVCGCLERTVLESLPKSAVVWMEDLMRGSGCLESFLAWRIVQMVAKFSCMGFNILLQSCGDLFKNHDWCELIMVPYLLCRLLPLEACCAWNLPMRVVREMQTASSRKWAVSSYSPCILLSVPQPMEVHGYLSRRILLYGVSKVPLESHNFSLKNLWCSPLLLAHVEALRISLGVRHVRISSMEERRRLHGVFCFP